MAKVNESYLEEAKQSNEKTKNALVVLACLYLGYRLGYSKRNIVVNNFYKMYTLPKV